MKKMLLVLTLTFLTCNQVLAEKTLDLRIVPAKTSYSTGVDKYIYEKPSQSRTIRDFRYRENAISISDKWALKNKFVPVSANLKSSRIYKRGLGILSSPTICEIRQTGENVHIEAYSRPSELWNKLTFHKLPKEMKLTPGGFKLISSRAEGRYFVNKLLINLGQENILIDNVLIRPKVDSL